MLKILGFSGPLRIGCNNRATASGGDDFVAVEAETSNISQRAGKPSAVRRAQAFARILDHNQSKFAGQRYDGIHVGGMAQDVNWQDRPHPPAGPTIVQLAVRNATVFSEEIR